MGSRDRLWEPDTASVWAEELTCFQQLQDGCQVWNWSKYDFKAKKRKGFGAVKLGPYSSRQPQATCRDQSGNLPLGTYAKPFQRKPESGKNKRLKEIKTSPHLPKGERRRKQCGKKGFIPKK